VKEDHDLSYLKKVKSKVDCWKAPDEVKKQSVSSTIVQRESESLKRSKSSLERTQRVSRQANPKDYLNQNYPSNTDSV
jgi:hypothetical protein